MDEPDRAKSTPLVWMGKSHKIVLSCQGMPPKALAAEMSQKQHFNTFNVIMSLFNVSVHTWA